MSQLNPKTIRKHLDNYIRSNGYGTMNEVARAVDISRQTLSLFRNGHGQVSEAILGRLVDFLARAGAMPAQNSLQSLSRADAVDGFADSLEVAAARLITTARILLTKHLDLATRTRALEQELDFQRQQMVPSIKRMVKR